MVSRKPNLMHKEESGWELWFTNDCFK